MAQFPRATRSSKVYASPRDFLKGIMKGFLLSLLTIGIVAFCDVGIVSAADDWQYWNELILKREATKKVDFHIKLEQRFVDDFREFALHNYAPGFVYKFQRHFDFELNYKFEREKGKRQWRNEHRIEMIPIIKWQWSELKFKLRNRLEYRNIDGDESWRLREKIKVNRAVGFDGFYVTPYVSEEIFYDFKIGDFNQNRVSIGLSKYIISDLGISIYYMLKSNKRERRWSHANVVGTKVLIAF